MTIDFQALGLRDYQPYTPTGSDTVTQADFLTLLTTQLKNQDPTSPLENETFVAQLAQFSTVSGIGDMNAKLSALNSLASTTAMAGAGQWIGREVTGTDNSVGKVASVSMGENNALTLTLEGGATMALANVVRVA